MLSGHRQSFDSAVRGGDWATAVQIAIQMILHERSRDVLECVVDVLAAMAAVDPTAQRPRATAELVRQLEAGLRGLRSADVFMTLGRALYEAGLRRDAAEKWRKAIELEPTHIEAARHLCLAEIQAALATPLGQVNNLISRWRRAWAHCSFATASDERFEPGIEGRCRVYGIECRQDFAHAARAKIQDRFALLIARQIESARAENNAPAATALRQLSEEIHADACGMQVFRAALEHDSRSGATGTPRPFGLMWYRMKDEHLTASQSLQEAIERSMGEPVVSSDAETIDPSMRVLGASLRQWYSRLAPVRHAVWWGQFETANALLQRICGAEENCRTNLQPRLGTRFGTPRCCDPDCAQFVICNPGYAHSSDAGRDMEEDAHRLGMFIQLCLAGQWLVHSPPGRLLGGQL